MTRQLSILTLALLGITEVSANFTPLTPAPDDDGAPRYAAEQMAEFPGGTKSLQQFLQANFCCENLSKEDRKEAQKRVVVRFVVLPDGSINRIEFLSDVPPAVEREWRRTLWLMPTWKPAQNDAHAVSVTYTVPLQYNGECNRSLACNTVPGKNNSADYTSMCYYPNGNLRSETPYHNNVKQGTEKVYRPNGTSAWQATYQNGVISGVETCYYENGKIAVETTYENGKKNGVEKQYSEDGVLFCETNFFDNMKQGVETWFYYIGGSIRQETQYWRGVKSNFEKTFYRNGALLHERIFRNGTCILLREYAHGGLAREVSTNAERYFYPNGMLKIERIRKDRNSVVQRHYNEHGKLTDEKIVGE